MSSNVERSFILEDLIQLPRFDAVGAVALGEKLLQVAAAARLASASAADPVIVAEADRSLDACWTALYDWLTGFSKLPDDLHETTEARGLLTELYPDGLSFILLPYELEWNQSDIRLARIAAERLGERIRALGGGVFITSLRRSHDAYGKLLGLPRAVAPREAGTPSVAEALESFAAALRVYALKVTAAVEVDEPETAAVSKRLLDPLLHWQGPSRDVELTLH